MSTSSTPASAKPQKPAFSTQSLVTMAIFAAILSISAYISVPTPLPGSPHITLLNFVILLIGLLFPTAQSFLIILVWMLLGAVGIPVFIGGGAGFGYLLGPWGGYTLSYLGIAILMPLSRGKKYSRVRFTIVSIIAALLIDLVGMLWLMAMNHLNLQTGFLTGFLPFLPLDMVKAVVVAQIIPPFRRIMKY